jgi:glycosyltransferase involved in cell wall biosynthesis
VNIAFVTTHLPADRRSGGERVSQAFVDALRDAGHRVTVLGFRRSGDRPALHPDDVAAADRPIETARAPLRAALWLAAALVAREPYSIAKYRSRVYRAALRRILAERRPALVVIDHAGVGAARRVLPAGTPTAYLAHNVEHQLYTGLAAAARGARRAVLEREARLTRRLETELVRAAREVWALSEADARALEDLGARRARTFAVPARGDPDGPPSADVDVAVLGTWTWSANAVGLEWFCEEVLPELPAELRVEVAGEGSERVDGRRAGVVGRGRVPDAAAFLRSARVVAVPSVAGAGVQIKTLDAIASGREVVATSTAARGLDDLPATVTVTDDAHAFAAALADAARRPPDDATPRAAADWVARRARAFGHEVASAAAAAGAGA